LLSRAVACTPPCAKYRLQKENRFINIPVSLLQVSLSFPGQGATAIGGALRSLQAQGLAIPHEIGLGWLRSPGPRGYGAGHREQGMGLIPGALQQMLVRTSSGPVPGPGSGTR